MAREKEFNNSMMAAIDPVFIFILDFGFLIILYLRLFLTNIKKEIKNITENYWTINMKLGTSLFLLEINTSSGVHVWVSYNHLD